MLFPVENGGFSIPASHVVCCFLLEGTGYRILPRRTMTLGQLDVGLEWEELVKLEGCARVSIVFDRAF